MSFNRARFHPELEIGGFSFYDGTLAFYLRVDALLKKDSVLLDVGCGRGAYLDTGSQTQIRLRDFRSKCSNVIGLDVDPAASSNPTLCEFRLIPPRSPWPVESEAADLIVADWVIEHVPNPDAFFAEAYRSLKPGGALCLRTSNLLNYAYLASRLIPNKLHKSVLRSVQRDRAEFDSFPTYYRCNTKARMETTLRSAGFDPVVLMWEAEPGYLEFSPLSYRLGLLISKVSPRLLHNTILAFGLKKSNV